MAFVAAVHRLRETDGVMKTPTSKLSVQSAFSLVELLVVIAVIAVIAAIAIPNIAGITEQAKTSSYKRNAQNIASVSAAAAAAGASVTQLGADLTTCIDNLAAASGISVTNNGQVMGPFRVDGLQAGASADTNITKHLTRDTATGIIRYTPSTN